MTMQAGTLTVKLLYANDLKDGDWFGKQDPYSKLTIGSQTYRSKTHKDGGKNPVWNESFKFNVINDNTLAIEIYDEDTLTKDDLIGKAIIDLSSVRANNTQHVSSNVSRKNGKQKGQIHLDLEFEPQSASLPEPDKTPAKDRMSPMPAAPPPAPAAYAPPPGPGAYAPPPGPPAPGYPAPPVAAYSSGSYSSAPPAYPSSHSAPSGYPPAGYPPAGYPPAAPPGYPSGSNSYSAPHGYPPAPSGYPPAGYPPHGYPPSHGHHVHHGHPPGVHKPPKRHGNGAGGALVGALGGLAAGLLIADILD